MLVKLLCDELSVDPEQILDFELCLADAVPGVSFFLNDAHNYLVVHNCLVESVLFRNNPSTPNHIWN